MDKELRNEASAWIARAEDDFAAARKLISGDDPLPATAAYHCQQAAEKALKAILAACDQTIPKTHDLRLLTELVAERHRAFAQCMEAAEWLNPFATEFRYPTDAPDPGLADASKALAFAAQILAAVQSWLGDSQSDD
ncbi:MAG TPA: HEPN domain-containing protein [Rhodocyclaceae bacterium]|nr:HEPN domain-containing protein [Rhodocyclaceae bacterium]